MRLKKQLGLGPTGLQRRFGVVEDEPRAGDAVLATIGSVVGLAELGARVKAANACAAADAAGQAKKKRGPPPGPRPWLKEGVSRATYFRRKKGGGG